MGLLDELRRMKGDGGIPEQRGAGRERSRGAFERLPPQFHSLIEDIARDSHKDFKKEFPPYQEFRDAVAECWLEQAASFEEELSVLKYLPIESGVTTPENIHGGIVALLIENGSFVLIGPGSLSTQGEGAAISYTGMKLRAAAGHTSSDITQPTGFVFGRMPEVGKPIFPRFNPQKGHTAPFVSTLPILKRMWKPAQRATAITEIEAAITEISAKFMNVQRELGLIPAQPK